MGEKKVIYNFVRMPSTFFGKNDKAQRKTIFCEMSHNCDAFKQGKCILQTAFGGACVYGRSESVEGPTARAMNKSAWVKKNKEMYPGDLTENLASVGDGIYEIGEYFYLPYNFMNFDNKRTPFLSAAGFCSSGRPFLKKEDFTIETIKGLLTFRPQAIMGGEIVDYQKKSVPQFLRHLLKKYPDLYKAVVAELPQYALTETQLSNVGRKAKLFTLKPNIGEFTDIHSAHWKWDGEFIYSTNSRASFILAKTFSEIRVRPDESTVVVISNDDQVSDETVFED